MDIGIITGASSGLGWEFALQISRRYPLDELWLIARREERLQLLSEQLETHSRIFSMDLTRPENLTSLQTALSEKPYRVRFLINNAGFGKRGPFQKLSLDSQLDMIDLNIRALVQLTYYCLPVMQSGDRILQVASSAGLLPMGNFSVYSATKAFVINFSNGLAAELSKKNITVTAVCPGPVETEFHRVATDGQSDSTSLPMATSEQVVYKALNDAERGKWMSLYGASIKFLPLITRVFSRKFLARVAKRF